MALDFQKSISDPISQDIGNKVVQGRTVDKTIQLGLFTTNKNAVWGSNQQLLKESYPFAMVSIPLNRNLFRLQVGDVFKWTYSKYSIVDMILRVLNVEEESLQSENIIVHCIEDFYGVANLISQDEYTSPTDVQTPLPDYTVIPLDKVRILEAPYALSNTVQIIPIAGKNSDYLTGFNVHMSADGGGSYSLLANSQNLAPHGILNAEYLIGLTIDLGETGIVVDFTEGAASLETATFGAILAGESNLILINDELMSFTTITPIAGVQYRLTGIIRNRYGTERADHAATDDIYFVGKSAGMISHSEIAVGAERKFKLVPYNTKKTGDIAEALVIDLSVVGQALTPYRPTNFDANGETFNPLYTSGTDITLTWTPRKRGTGAGVGQPGIVLGETSREGFFKIEVWVSAALVRTTLAIDAVTWDYTDAMNVSDNGTPADLITFKIYNYREDGGNTLESDPTEVNCSKL